MDNGHNLKELKDTLVEELLLYRKEYKWDKVAEILKEYRKLMDATLDGEDLLMINDCFYLTLYEIEANTYLRKSHLNYRRILYGLSLLDGYPDSCEEINRDKMEPIEDIPQFKLDGYSYMGKAMFEDNRASDALRLYRKSYEYLSRVENIDVDQVEGLVESIVRCYKYLSRTSESYLPELREMFKNYLSSERIDKIAEESHASFLKHDPIEDTPAYLSIKEELETALYEKFEGQDYYMGLCHQIWSAKRDLLLSKYGIEWRSPALMNPRVMFD